jgi:hypothetical protein
MVKKKESVPLLEKKAVQEGPHCGVCGTMLVTRQLATKEPPVMTGIVLPMLTDVGPVQGGLAVCTKCLTRWVNFLRVLPDKP